jgi:predicted metal-dependent hydrolase
LNQSIAQAGEIKQTLHHNGVDVPVYINIAPTRSSKVRFTKRGIDITISSYSNEKQRQEQIVEFKNWCIKKLTQTPNMLASRELLQYRNGDTITLLGKVFTLKIEDSSEQLANGKALKDDGILLIKVPVNYTQQQKYEAIRSLTIALAKKICLKPLTERINYWNDLYFQKPISKVLIRDKTSSWGSCSSNGSINMSVSLLKAPTKSIDYVIVHELAHLIEFNHSDRFWAIVANIMPDYEVYELDLKKNQFLYRF